MTEDSPPIRGRAGRIALGVGLLAAGAVAGGVLAGTLSASASNGPASTSAGAAAGAAGYGDAAAPSPGTFRLGGKAPVRSDEKAVTGTLEAKLRAAALEAVPGGTVYRIESDAGDGVYEAHMTKAGGTPVTVKFAKDGSVTKIEDGMGTGDPQSGDGPGH